MMKIGLYDSVQKLYEDSVSKRNENPFAVPEGKREVEEAAVYAPTKTSGAEKLTAGKKTAESKLSDSAKELLAKLREKYSDMDLMVADFSTEEEAQSILSKGSKEYSVLITPDELEKMAADASYQEEMEGKITDAVEAMKSMAASIQEKIDKGEEGFEDLQLTGMSVSFDSDGNATYFASLEKISEAQKEHIAKLQEKRAEEKSKEEKEAESPHGKEIGAYRRIDWEGKRLERMEFPRKTVSGTTQEELLEAITGIDWSESAAMSMPVAGGKIDYAV